MPNTLFGHAADIGIKKHVSRGAFVIAINNRFDNFLVTPRILSGIIESSRIVLNPGRGMALEQNKSAAIVFGKFPRCQAVQYPTAFGRFH